MITNAKRASAIRIAALDFMFIFVKVQRLLAGLLMASVAEVSTVEADIEGDIAAEPALIVDVLISMLFLMAGKLAKSELF